MKRRKVNKKELIDGNANIVFGKSLLICREDICTSRPGVWRNREEGRIAMIAFKKGKTTYNLMDSIYIIKIFYFCMSSLNNAFRFFINYFTKSRVQTKYVNYYSQAIIFSGTRQNNLGYACSIQNYSASGPILIHYFPLALDCFPSCFEAHLLLHNLSLA